MVFHQHSSQVISPTFRADKLFPSRQTIKDGPERAEDPTWQWARVGSLYPIVKWWQDKITKVKIANVKTSNMSN